MPKKYVVTGGAGFIGYHLCKRLLKEGHRVICLDNFSTSAKHHETELKKLESETAGQFEVQEKDIREPWGIYSQESCAGIFHLACPASPKHYQKTPYDTITTCVQGTQRVLKAAEAHPSNIRIIFASTSEIYGEPAVTPQPETYRGNTSCTGPRACYDEGKRAMESMAISHKEQHGTDIGIVRIFNTYGPEMDEEDGRVVSNFITQMLRKEAVTIYGDGMQRRSFCFVDDMVEGLIRMMDSGEQGPINLGNPHEITIKELSNVIHNEIYGSDSEPQIHYEAARQDDPSERCPDIAKAGELLDWRPKISLREGIARTVEYFRT